MSKDSEYSRDEIAGFNGSLATLERIDIVIRNAMEHDLTDNAFLHRKCLISWFKRVTPYLNEQEYKDATKQVQALTKANITRQGTRVMYDDEARALLDAFEIWLERKSFKYNLTMMKGDRSDPRYAILNDEE